MGARTIKVGDHVRVVNTGNPWHGSILRVVDADPGTEHPFLVEGDHFETGNSYQEWVEARHIAPLSTKEHAEIILDQLAEE